VTGSLPRPKRRTRLARAGAIYILVIVAVGLAAGGRPNNLLVWVFSFLLAAMLASGIVSGFMLMPVRALRIEPRRGRVGEPLLVRYEIANASRFLPAYDLRVDEWMFEPRSAAAVSSATVATIANIAVPGTSLASATTSASATPSASATTAEFATSTPDHAPAPRTAPRSGLLRRGRAPRQPLALELAGPAWILHVGPREQLHGEAVYRPTRRGRLRLSEFEVSTTFPFGLMRKVLRFDQPGEVLIHPEIAALRPEVLSRVTSGGYGGHRLSSESGGADDFFGVREYRPGDSIRTIAWKRLAGTGQLATIERSRSVPPRVRVLIDLRTPTDAIRTTGGEDARALEERAIVLAASFLALADRLGYEYALSIAGFDIPPVSLRKGHFHREKLMSALAAIDLDAPRSRGNGLAASDERATVVVVHPDRSDLAVAPADAWHFTARQLDTLVDHTHEPAPREAHDGGGAESTVRRSADTAGEGASA
jgi:uncharacterized protein (DUF58 family)